MLRSFWYVLCKYVLVVIPTLYFSQIVYLISTKRLGFKWRSFNFNRPKTFNEKLNLLKVKNNFTSLQTQGADKYRVREYVAKKIGNTYLIPLLGVYKDAKDIDLDKLPNQFVIKANHGSGWNLICKDKKDIYWPKAIKQLNQWLGRNAYYLSREPQYRDIKPLLVCEEMVGYNIKDYKFFCSNGKVKFIQVDSDRFSNHQRTILTTEWTETDILIRYRAMEELPPRPEGLSEMLKLAEKLAEPFQFVRVDLYYHEKCIYFGELTFFPGGGTEPFNNIESEMEFGKLIELES